MVEPQSTGVGLKVGVTLFADSHLARLTGLARVRSSIGIPNARAFLATGTNQHHLGGINRRLDLNPPTLRLLAAGGNGTLMLDHDIDAFDNDPVVLGIDDPDCTSHAQVFAPNDLDRITLFDLHQTFSLNDL
jgi:hypothetical protein